MSLRVIVLAAGKGTRMRSKRPKVLHTIAGVSLLAHVLKTVQSLSPEEIYVVHGYEGAIVQAECADFPVTWIHQSEPLGTGHAVRQVLPHLNDSRSQVLVLYGDVPLIQASTLATLIQKTPFNTLGILTANFSHPKGLGRIIRDENNHILQIKEEKDATIKEQEIQEINSGICVTSSENLQRWLPQLSAHNAQKEYYLTDIVELAVKEKLSVVSVTASKEQEVQGVNDRQQLVALERFYQKECAQQLLLSGVTLLDPDRFDLRGQCDVAADVTIDVNVIFEGHVKIDADTLIGPNCLLRNVTIGKNVEIKANCVLEDAVIGDNCKVGPFARIRPGTTLSSEVSIGNFVEIKNSAIGCGSKIPHLSYVGDADFGVRVNFGAGAITCNYDGVKKNRTTIGDGAFIGSDVQLIAPVTIGDNAYVAAGSTINKNTLPNTLTIGRAKQQTIENWRRPYKAEKN